MHKAFTLIELLVVVLIIGILVAVALPKYEIAVEKARAAELIMNINSIINSARLYHLETGFVNDDETVVSFTGKNRKYFPDKDIFAGMNCNNYCDSANFRYWVYSQGQSVFIDVSRINSSFSYNVLISWRAGRDRVEDKDLYTTSNQGIRLCKALKEFNCILDED